MSQQNPQFNINELIASLKTSQDEANAAGLARFKGLTGRLGNIRKRTLGPGGIFDQQQANQNQLGATAGLQIGDAETQNLASSEQDLISRGLGNTTVRSAVRRGVQSDATRQRGALSESLAAGQNDLLGRRAAADFDIGRFQTDLGLSRQDQGPDQALYLDLIRRITETNAQNNGNTGGVQTGPGGRSFTTVGNVPSGPRFGSTGSPSGPTGSPGVTPFTAGGPTGNTTAQSPQTLAPPVQQRQQQSLFGGGRGVNEFISAGINNIGGGGTLAPGLSNPFGTPPPTGSTLAPASNTSLNITPSGSTNNSGFQNNVFTRSQGLFDRFGNFTGGTQTPQSFADAAGPTTQPLSRSQDTTSAGSFANQPSQGVFDLPRSRDGRSDDVSVLQKRLQDRIAGPRGRLTQPGDTRFT